MSFRRRLICSLLAIFAIVLYALVLVVPEDEQSLLTPLLVCLSVAFAFACCIPVLDENTTWRNLDPFHPLILFLVFYLAYFVFSGVLVWQLRDYGSLWVNLGGRPAFVVNTIFFLGIVSVGAFASGVHARIAFPGKSIRALLYRGDVLRLREMRYLVVLFLVIGTGFSIYHLSLLGPLSSDVLLYLSPAARRDLGLNLSNAFLVFESMLNWAALLATFYYIVRYANTEHKGGAAAIAVLLLIAAMVLSYVTSGKRSTVIPLLLLPVIWHHYLVRRLDIAKAGMYLVIGVTIVTVLLLARIAIPVIVRDLDPAVHLGANLKELVLFYLDTGEWSTFDMVAASLVKRDELLSNMDGALWGFLKYTFGTLVVVVPRAIWIDKPVYEDPGQVFYRTLTGGTEEVGIAITVWGAAFLFFHVVGMSFGMFVVGWIFRGIYALLQPWRRQPFDVFFYGIFYWMAFQFLRFGTLGFTVLLFVQTMIVGFCAGLVLARGARANRRPELRRSESDKLVRR